MSETHNLRAKEILSTIRYATIATASKDGKPWNTPVAHTFDDNLNLYWVSDKENRHSKNVRENENIAIVIYSSTVAAGSEAGVYFEAKAVELNDPEEILKMRRIKKGQDYEGSPGEFLGDAVRRVYKATLLSAWMNEAEYDGDTFVRDYRVEIPLASLK